MYYRLKVTAPAGDENSRKTIVEADTRSLSDCKVLGEAFMEYNKGSGFFAQIFG